MKNRQSIIWSIPKDELQLLLDTKDSFSDIMRHFGFGGTNGSVRTLYARIEKDNLNDSRIRNDKPWTKLGKNTKRADSEVFCKDSTYAQCSLKNRIIKENLIPYSCSECGIENLWNDKPLSLQLEHKNGISNDHRISNLTFLCPNCHSQTPTYAGKSKTRAVKNRCIDCNGIIHNVSKRCSDCSIKNMPLKFDVSRDELIELVCDKKISFVKIGKLFNVSDNSIRKRCEKFGINPKTRRLI